MEDKDKASNISSSSNTSDTCINCPILPDLKMEHKHTVCYYKEHPKYPNIDLETIEHHLKFLKCHKIENAVDEGA